MCEVEKPAATNRSKDVGIDLGFKTVAAASDGFDLDDGNFYRDLEVRLGDAQRRGDKRAVKTIHARIKNRRKDSLHKYSRAVVDGAGGVFVGNISANWQISSGKGKSVNDMGWSKLRNILKYKCDHAGVAYAEVFEAYTTQDCSCCLARTGPKGVEELNTRRWTCSECGAEHLRDRNAAINIARLDVRRWLRKQMEAPSFRAGRLHRPDGDARVSDISGAGPDVGRPMVNAGFADRRQCRGSTVRILQSL